MRFSMLTGLLAALAVAGEAKPVRRTSRHVVHEEGPTARRSWSKSTRYHQTAVLPVRIGLAQQNLHRAEEFLYDVSHPDSPNYGKHWPPGKIVETFAPKKEAAEAVTEWLESKGISPSRVQLSGAKNWLSFNATVREVERLLRTEYHVYKHHKTGRSHVACDKYHVPEHLSDHIDIVTPTVHFDAHVGDDRRNKQQGLSERHTREVRRFATVETQRNRRQLGVLGSPTDGSNPKQGAIITNALMDLDQCDTMITPACLRALYKSPAGTTASINNTLGIVEYTPQAFLQSDLDLYFSQFETRLKGKSPAVQLVDNGIVQTQNQSFSFNGESALDLEFAMALIFPQKATLSQVGDLAQSASFNNFLDALDGSYCAFGGGDSQDTSVDGQYPSDVACGTHTPTNVISTSYSYNEADLSPRYEKRQCAEYMKLGLRGVSVVYSSGDFGVAGNAGACIDPATGAYNTGDSGKFNPSFPASCPYDTSVGATQLLNGCSVRSAESACQDVIFSGGGFSNVFGLPSYQKRAVGDYLANSAPSYGAGRFNNSGAVRGLPDVSANGANFVTAVDGNFTLSFGTSASAPVFASILTLLNDKRIQAGKGPIGFVNPALYANADVLNDITEGNNPGCGTDGFEAVRGWDPLTGLGTPNYPRMEKLFLALP